MPCCIENYTWNEDNWTEAFEAGGRGRQHSSLSSPLPRVNNMAITLRTLNGQKGTQNLARTNGACYNFPSIGRLSSAAGGALANQKLLQLEL